MYRFEVSVSQKNIIQISDVSLLSECLWGKSAEFNNCNIFVGLV